MGDKMPFSYAETTNSVPDTHSGSDCLDCSVGRVRGRDAVEARDDGAAAFNDGESPYCLAYRLCRALFAGFDSGRALG